jgi:hypothetical protein
MEEVIMKKEKSIWGIVEISSEVIGEKELFTRVATVKEEPMVPAKLGRKTIESKLAMQAAMNSASQLLDSITNGSDSKSDQQTVCLNILLNLKKVCEDMETHGLWVDDFCPSPPDLSLLLEAEELK